MDGSREFDRWNVHDILGRVELRSPLVRDYDFRKLSVPRTLQPEGSQLCEEWQPDHIAEHLSVQTVCTTSIVLSC